MDARNGGQTVGGSTRGDERAERALLTKGLDCGGEKRGDNRSALVRPIVWHGSGGEAKVAPPPPPSCQQCDQPGNRPSQQRNHDNQQATGAVDAIALAAATADSPKPNHADGPTDDTCRHHGWVARSRIDWRPGDAYYRSDP
ncbi:hypothetical protein EmuJ_000565000 [Echinococcus multilocularis]|uniref:Uncharacterized protein n=1 Tax=Echinococcus multilocularis TaxID=6211 RepID=A0A068Y7I8_ECHMU|nr:hypothetical protein EmuJ_000565000 [Echinococcus multilocularis]